MSDPATPERGSEDPVDWRRTDDGVRLFDPETSPSRLRRRRRARRGPSTPSSRSPRRGTASCCRG
ncbi:hypothetical protein, partial [Natrialba sp. PRR66]|uniref:hypothetical protein n=1 Tax=Natrialba sp. PRR66 TaxID=3098146 RepID=UPI002B1D5E86